MRRPLLLIALVAHSAAVTSCASAPGQRSANTPSEGARPQAAAPADSQRQSQSRGRPRPYAQVITGRAVTDSGGITSHRVDDRWFLELPDSLLWRDMLLVGRIAGVPANIGGFLSAGTSVQERLVRWEKVGDRVFLRAYDADAFSEDTLPIALSVAANNIGPILAAFPVQAYGRDSALVIDVTEFFSGDTPALSGLSSQQRSQYQVRRLDPSRSFIQTIRSHPLNVEVRHTQTFEANASPSDRAAGALSLEMRQSLVVLPAQPMRPRYADARAGFFTVERINYGLDEQKAATQTFITRWRLEPKDPAAYARGELVEPVQPIVYYIDPATPTRWRPYVKQGVEDWQRAFEKAGFRNAIIARDPPSPEEDPTWDPEDIRHSTVRWAASTVRNAVGPSTVDPRTGEIIESDITWYHNHMRSYRNRLMIETGASNPMARTLDIPEELMGETMRNVIAHEIGHALGLPHNMVASSSFPVDSLRSQTFAREYGVSATIMDYARQNYIAQPGDGLKGADYVRQIGPFDEFIIEWGYRVFPDAPTPEAEQPILDEMLREQSGPMAYRYLPQYFAGIDPRSQTEDLGNDPVKAGTYAIANLERVVPKLVEWTTTPGEDYTDLAELYGETVGMWSRYMGHVVSLIGGIHVDLKTADQDGAVYRPVPEAEQERALAFLAENAIETPEWLAPPEITRRIGPAPLADAQSGIVSQLLDPRRLERLNMAEELAPGTSMSLPAYLAALRRTVWSSREPDANRRTIQRVYIDRLTRIVEPPEPSGQGGQGGGGGGRGEPPSPIIAAPNLPRTDLPAMARAELTAVRGIAQSAAGGTSGVHRAHWRDIIARIDEVLEVAGR